MIIFYLQGTYSSEGSESCTTCENGKISDTKGASECTACGAGEIAKDSHTKCELCPSVSISLLHTHL